MKEKGHDSSRMRRFLNSRLFLIVALIAVGFTALGYARAYYQDYKIRQEIASLEQEVHNLESKRLESLEILKYVTSDAFVEEKARTELNLKKPGEKVVVIQHQEEDRDQKLAQSSTDQTHLSNPQKWWYYFTHRTPEGDVDSHSN